MEQIALLQALTAGLLDAIPIERIPAAEQAVRTAVAQLSPPISERYLRAGPDSAADSKAVQRIIIDALVPFRT